MSGLCAMLKSCGVDIKKKVDFALDGQEAVDTVKRGLQFGISYKFILTDINMPKLDGIQATQLIREYYKEEDNKRLKQPWIVGLTGHFDESFKSLAIDAGMIMVEPKPMYKMRLSQLLTDYYF